MEQLLEKGWKIGAENSGHVILLDKVTTGDRSEEHTSELQSR